MEKYHRLYETICGMLYEARGLESAAVGRYAAATAWLDSLDYMELMLVVRREFGITLAAEMLIDHPELTLGELCHVIIRQ